MDRKDNIKPVQPYLIIDTENYVQVKSDLLEISHFYSFSFTKGEIIRLVPDGSVDIIFVFQDNTVRVFLVNAKLQYEEISSSVSGAIFGVRFMPAVLPKMALSKKNSSVFTIEEYCAGNESEQKLFNDMLDAQDINEQIDIFIHWYNSLDEEVEIDVDKMSIVSELRKAIICSDGKIRISELGRIVGYSERYINRLFSNSFGYSPKTLCKVIQFQKALEYLDYGYPENMTEAAVSLGYYDQSQFIKVFASFANTTPKRYYSMMEKHNFKKIMKSSTIEAAN